MNGMPPSEFAKKCQETYAKYGTKTEVAKQLNVSTATVSRYMALLHLPENELKKVDAGTIPVRIRTKSKRITPEINARLNALIQTLEHTVFATQAQLEAYTKQSFSVNRDTISLAVRKRLITKETAYKPYSYCLTSKGAALLGAQLPKHFMSDAAIHQRLLRNEIEIEAQKVNKNNHFVSRPELWRRGLYPSFGEWCLQFEDREGVKKMALVLIDDYGMPASRLKKVLQRNHSTKVDPKTKKVTINKVIEKNAPDKKNMTWEKAVTRFVVHSTSALRISKFQQYVDKHKEIFIRTQPIFRTINAIWDVGL